MAGCLRNTLAGVGCLTVLAVVGVGGWKYRGQVAGLYRSFRGPSPAAPAAPAVAASPGEDTARVGEGPADRESQAAEAVPGAASPPVRSPVPPEESPVSAGRPSEAALRSARWKEALMERPNGPRSVTLTAAEMASLIQDGLDPVGRRALDSLEVFLAPGRLELRAELITENLSGLLGPFAAMFRSREPMRVSGPAHLARPGVAAWQPDSFVLRAFPFPPGLVPALVDRLTGGAGGTVPIRVPLTVGGVRIAPGGVTFLRGEAR
jgi:hypothetical protein